MEGTKYCMGCMNKLDWDGRCHQCTFVEDDYECDQQLPLHTSLKQGEYMVGRKLGNGGFGITYIGLDTTLLQTVAIKEYFPIGIVQREGKESNNVSLIDERYRQDYDKGLQSFLREGRILAQFSNLTAVAGVKQFFHENNTAYLAMEYVDGISVREYVQQYGAIEPEQALNMISQVIMDLQTIHSRQVLHRDVSADNLIITRNGKLKLIDFGSTRQGFAQDYYTTTILCKQGYSAIEQYSTGKNQGPWTDIYGLCASLYYMLTGNVPDNAPDRIQHDRVVPVAGMKELALTPEQKRAIDKGIAVSVDDRFKTMAELYYALYGERLEEISVYDRRETATKPVDTAKENTPSISRTWIRRELGSIEDEKQKERRIEQCKKIVVIVGVLILIAVGVFRAGAKYSNFQHAKPAMTEGSKQKPENVIATEQPKSTEQAGATEEPKSAEQAGATEQPKSAIKAGATEQPKSAVKAAATKKPKRTVKDAATKKPKRTVKAAATKKPKRTTKVTATKKPSQNKTSATKKPSATAKAKKKDPSVAGSLEGLQ